MVALSFIPTPIRIFLAASLVAVAFAGERYVYHGWCLFPADIEEVYRFIVFPLLFFVGFVWLCAEVIGRALSFVRLPRLVTWPVTVVAGVVLYLAVAGAFWLVNPTIDDLKDETGHRAAISFLWSVGILVETGNFDEDSCPS